MHGTETIRRKSENAYLPLEYCRRARTKERYLMTGCMRGKRISCLSAGFLLSWVYHRMAVRCRRRTGQQCRAVSSSFCFLQKTIRRVHFLLWETLLYLPTHSCADFYGRAKPDPAAQYNALRWSVMHTASAVVKFWDLRENGAPKYTYPTSDAEILKFSASYETHFKSILMFGGPGQIQHLWVRPLCFWALHLSYVK